MSVQMVASLVVTPSEETPSHGLWLSPLDVVNANGGYTPTVYLYRRHSSQSRSGADDHDFFNVERMKASLGKALVAFYPLAGRLAVDVHGRLEIDCTGQGVDLVIARSSDLTVDGLSGYPYRSSPEVKKLLVPRVIEEESPSVICAVQVTSLKCGGVALGAALHHAVMDGVSAFNFFKTWSAFSRSRCGDMDEQLELPCHDRTLLRARSPPQPVADAALHRDAGPSMKGPFIEKIFSISKDQVTALKGACSRGRGAMMSTFCALSAHVWRCMCIARRLPLEGITELNFPANIRRILMPPLPDTYFGNAIITMAAVGKVGDIIASDHLASTAERVSDASRRIDNELVRSEIDYSEEVGGPFPGNLPVTVVKVISWLGMPIYHADFSWGKPHTMMRAEIKYAGFVYLIDGGQGDGTVHVICSETLETLEDFQRLLYANI